MPIPKYVCASCGYKEKPLNYKKGSWKVEIILWICFLVPGLLYSIWRSYTAIKVCPLCKTATMISTKTAHGQRLSGF